MSYTVRSSEKTRKSGADGETKALLYLMNFRSDSSEIHYYIVDFFNDLTGMDRFSINLWDVQSKAAKNNSPKAIGKELVTLFKNYLSEFEFSHYILFIGGVTGTLRVDSALNSFDISNITNAAMIKLIEGLKEEAWEKTYIANNDITDKNISDFLKKVLILKMLLLKILQITRINSLMQFDEWPLISLNFSPLTIMAALPLIYPMPGSP